MPTPLKVPPRRREAAPQLSAPHGRPGAIRIAVSLAQSAFDRRFPLSELPHQSEAVAGFSDTGGHASPGWTRNLSPRNHQCVHDQPEARWQAVKVKGGSQPSITVKTAKARQGLPGDGSPEAQLKSGNGLEINKRPTS
jgi:hypothetical protein